jgi:hypothetical protein
MPDFFSTGFGSALSFIDYVRLAGREQATSIQSAGMAALE